MKFSQSMIRKTGYWTRHGAKLWSGRLEAQRLRSTLENIRGMKYTQLHTERLTPLGFPLWSMWVQAEVSSGQWRDRVQRMAEQLEAAATE